MIQCYRLLISERIDICWIQIEKKKWIKILPYATELNLLSYPADITKEVEKQMKVNKAKFKKEGQGNWLKAADCAAAETTVTILAYREQKFNDRTAPVIDVKMGKEEYGFALNATNLDRLIQKFGEDSDDWEGKKITFVKVKVTNPTTNKEVDSLRVKE